MLVSIIAPPRDFAQLYDSALHDTKVGKSKKIYEFPFWNQNYYELHRKHRIRQDRIKFLAECVDENQVLNEPGRIGDWLQRAFRTFQGKVKTSKYQEGSNEFFTDINEKVLGPRF